VLCAFAFYGNGNHQRTVGRMSELSLSQSMVARCIEEVTEALNLPDVLLRFIHFPSTRQEREEVILRFEFNEYEMIIMLVWHLCNALSCSIFNISGMIGLGYLGYWVMQMEH